MCASCMWVGATLLEADPPFYFFPALGEGLAVGETGRKRVGWGLVAAESLRRRLQV